MEFLQNMALYSELILCGNEVYTWCYRPDGTLLRSNCPDEAILLTAFDQLGCKRKMLEQAGTLSAPIMLGTAIGLNWYADCERRDGELLRWWVIGPVFYRELSLRAVENGFAYYDNLDISLAWKIQFLEVLRRIPATPNLISHRYALMLHYCLTGERLTVAELIVCDVPKLTQKKPSPSHDRHRVYMAEQNLMSMVRNGDLNYREALNTSSMLSSGIPLKGHDPLRQAQLATQIFATLVCRAAMEGGLSPEEAYSVSDAYIQMAEDAKTTDELQHLSGALYDDFIHRVHRMHANPTYSPAIQRCCDYIEQHLEQKILAEDLARVAGYSVYYLTQRFKKETGFSIVDYARFVKIERAKLLLSTTDESTSEIAERLGFGTRSYFSRVFTKIAGQTPQEYRESAGK